VAQVWTESCQWTTNSQNFVRRYAAGNVSFWGTGGRDNGPAFSGQTTAYPGAYTGPTGNPVCIFFQRLAVSYSGRFFGLGGIGSSNLTSSIWFAYADCFLAIASNGALQLCRYTNTDVVVAQSPPGLLTFIGTKFGLAGKITVHPTAGTCDLWLDGAPVPGLSGLTGLNTAQYGSQDWKGVVWDSNNPRCDIFVADATNPTGNDVHDVLLDVRVDYKPVNGNGYSAGFSGSDGNAVDNYALVADLSPDDDVSFVEVGVPAIDSYQVADVVAGTQVVGVTSLVTSRKSDAGVANLRQGIRSNLTNYMSTVYNPAISYVTASVSYGVNPNGNIPWTQAAFNGLEAVIERT
jgi:hypothetical protein